MKLGAHLFAFEVGGKLDRMGKALDFSTALWLVAPPPEPPIMEVRAAARTFWKLGSDVIAFVAAAMVSGPKCC